MISQHEVAGRCQLSPDSVQARPANPQLLLHGRVVFYFFCNFVKAMRHQDNIVKNESDSKTGKIVNVSEEQEVQIFAKQMLSKRLFVGHYQERRYVEPLNSYRDIVRVSEAEEDLTKDILIVKKRILPFYPPQHVWTGLTGPDMPGAPVGVCLWVQLTGVPFGHYWFQIREVKFVGSEIMLRLKCVRPYTQEGESLASKIFHLAKDVPSDSDSTNSTVNDLDKSPSLGVKNVLNVIKNIKYEELGASIWSSLTLVFTLQNMKDTSKFLVLILISAVAAAFNLVMYVGDFSLKLIHEISYLIRACTPIFLGIIDLCSKCVGGLYILIAMMWRGTPPNFPVQNRPKPLALQNYPHSSAANFRQQSRPPNFSQYR